MKTGSESSQLPRSLFSSASSRIKRSGYLKRFPTTKRKRRSKRRLSFRTFIRRVNPRYQFYRHTEVLIDVLQAVADDQVKRLMVFWPPRHSKSETVSRLFSASRPPRHPERFVRPGVLRGKSGLHAEPQRTRILSGERRTVGRWKASKTGRRARVEACGRQASAAQLRERASTACRATPLLLRNMVQ